MEELINSCICENVRRAFYVKATKDAGSTAPLTLAYIGDTVYDLFVRTYLITTTEYTVTRLHTLATHLVCASAQAKAFRKIEGMLSEEELAVFKRGRNAHSTVPKSASPSEYRIATGLEALIGYLYLSEQDMRLSELMRIILNKENLQCPKEN